ncbi:hypothetical protein HPB49_014517 [Dermacentor silvarum]|uniref:Uncharacterized protein n=1 Tax=Dermacentor silvarum TaxID=543639 RepID=A0ACB8DPT9_DERSI|nr:hypothetical protein HPB49_014517 [Dermacentor silvarum]
MNSAGQSTYFKDPPTNVVEDNGRGQYDAKHRAAGQVHVARPRDTRPWSAGKVRGRAVGTARTEERRKPGGSSNDWSFVLYGSPTKGGSAGDIPLLVRSLDPTRTVRDLDPGRVTRELLAESGVAPGSYCYVRLTRGGLLAVGARTAEAAVRSQRVRWLDGTPVEVIVPLWHGHNAAKIRHVPAWIDDADMRESLYVSAGVVSVRRLVAYGAPWADGRRRDVPQTSVVLVFRPELTRVPVSVTLCGVEYAVEPYALPPTQCMRCQRLGHQVAKCTERRARCKVCAGPHDYRRCDSRGRRPRCANCEGPHAATFAMCPVKMQFYAPGDTQPSQQEPQVGGLRRKRARIRSDAGRWRQDPDIQKGSSAQRQTRIRTAALPHLHRPIRGRRRWQSKLPG